MLHRKGGIHAFLTSPHQVNMVNLKLFYKDKIECASSVINLKTTM